MTEGNEIYKCRALFSGLVIKQSAALCIKKHSDRFDPQLTLSGWLSTFSRDRCFVGLFHL